MFSLCPPRVNPGAKFKYLNFGISIILLEIFFGHPPIEAVFAIRKKFPQFLNWKNKNDNLVFNICSDCEIGFTSERVAGRDRFLDIFSADAYCRGFSARIPASAFDGDTHEFVGMRISGNKIDSSVINPSALKAVF